MKYVFDDRYSPYPHLLGHLNLRESNTFFGHNGNLADWYVKDDVMQFLVFSKSLMQGGFRVIMPQRFSNVFENGGLSFEHADDAMLFRLRWHDGGRSKVAEP